jgi:mannose-1-phosphate guanylyltransferase
LEKTENPVTHQVNAGTYVFRRRVVDRIPAGRVVSVERETFPGLVADGTLVVGYVEDAYWRDVGTPAALVAASRDLVLGVAPSPAAMAEPGEAWVADGAHVDGSASLTGGSTVLTGALVRAGAVADGSVVMAGAVLGEGALVTDSVVGPGAVVGAGARLVAATVGDEAILSEGAVLEPGIRVECGAKV